MSREFFNQGKVQLGKTNITRDIVAQPYFYFTVLTQALNCLSCYLQSSLFVICILTVRNTDLLMTANPPTDNPMGSPRRWARKSINYTNKNHYDAINIIIYFTALVGKLGHRIF